MIDTRRLKSQLFKLLEPAAEGDRLGRAFDTTMVVLVLASVAAAVLSTVRSIGGAQAGFIAGLEALTVVIFTAEFGLRFWLGGLESGRKKHRARLRYLASLHGIADLAAVVPFWIGLLFPGQAAALHALAILRILKLVRYSPAVETLGVVLVNERRTLLAAGTIMIGLLLFSSTLLYVVERSSQPEAFGSIPAAMWWGIATLTTVGYGDVTPVTPVGKFFGAVVTILGIGMFALPAGILANGFGEEIKRRQFLVNWNLVAKVPLFSGLSAQDIAQITRLLEPLAVTRGQVVVHKGERADAMFFVSDGELQAEVGRRRARLGRGEFFGEIALLEGGTRSATVRALVPSQLLSLDKRHFEELVSARPAIAKAVAAVAKKRRRADRREPAKKATETPSTDE